MNKETKNVSKIICSLLILITMIFCVGYPHKIDILYIFTWLFIMFTSFTWFICAIVIKIRILITGTKDLPEELKKYKNFGKDIIQTLLEASIIRNKYKFLSMLLIIGDVILVTLLINIGWLFAGAIYTVSMVAEYKILEPNYIKKVFDENFL